MSATQQVTTNANVLDAVRCLVADDDRHSHDRRAAAVMRAIAVHKATNAAQGKVTEAEDNWALFLAAVERGAL
jgi:hypothetical protein